MMRFKADENLPPEVAAFLRDHGHDALTVWDEGMRGEPDQHLAKVCQSERRALVTLDLGFADIRTYPPERFTGLIVLRLNQQSRRHVLAVLPRVLELLKTEPLEGRLWIVDKQSLRVREGIFGEDE
jgi:predicted nuclease of predicted toxin-antitoxin system